jgi:hypothetical protein
MADLDAFKRDLRSDLKKGREAFEGKYGDQLSELMGLSKDEIDAITPDAVDLQEYDRLIAVVRQASRHNLSQAQLKANIVKLGDVAVTIAKKSATLAALLV